MRMLNYSSTCSNPYHRDYHRHHSPRRGKNNVARNQLVKTTSPSLSNSSNIRTHGNNSKSMPQSSMQVKVSSNGDSILSKEIPALPGTVFTKAEDPSYGLSMSSSDSYSELTYPVVSSDSSELEEMTGDNHDISTRRYSNRPDVVLPSSEIGTMGKFSGKTLQDTLSWRRTLSNETTSLDSMPSATKKGFNRGISISNIPAPDASTTATLGSQASTQSAELSAINAVRKVRQRLKDAKVNPSKTKTGGTNGLPDFMALRARLKKTKEVKQITSQRVSYIDHHSPFVSCNSTITSATTTSESFCSNDTKEKDTLFKDFSYPKSTDKILRFAEQRKIQPEETKMRAIKIVTREGHGCFQRDGDHMNGHQLQLEPTVVKKCAEIDPSTIDNLHSAPSGHGSEDSCHQIDTHIVAATQTSSPESSDNLNSDVFHQMYQEGNENEHSDETGSKVLKSRIPVALNAMLMQRAAGQQKVKSDTKEESHSPLHDLNEEREDIHDRLNALFSVRAQHQIPSKKLAVKSDTEGESNTPLRDGNEDKEDIHDRLNALFSVRTQHQIPSDKQEVKADTKVESNTPLHDGNGGKEGIHNRLNALFSVRTQNQIPPAKQDVCTKCKGDNGGEAVSRGSSKEFEAVDSRDDQESLPSNDCESDRHGYEKYSKMLKMGIPIGAVQNAMKRDGVDSSPMFGDKTGNTEITTSSKNKNRRDPYRRTRLHWVPVESFSKDSVWYQLALDEDIENIEIDTEEFNSLFQTKASVSLVSSRSRDNAAEGAVKVIDPKRANNGGIILARLRITHDEISAGIDAIDESFLTVQQITGIMEYIPTLEERKALNRFVESGQDIGILCECEKFMVSIMNVKEAKKKMKAMLFKLHFPVIVNDIVKSIETLSRACDEILTSNRLLKLLGVILKVGNRLNRAGVETIKTDAGGFAIESLRKLNQVKAWDKKTTLMMYISSIIQRWNCSLMDVKDELSYVLKSQKVSDYIPTLCGLEEQLVDVRKTVLSLQANGPGDCEDETTILSKSKVGLFVLNSLSTLEGVRWASDELENKFMTVVKYLAQKGDMKPVALFDIIASFCLELDSTRSQGNDKKRFYRND